MSLSRQGGHYLLIGGLQWLLDWAVTVVASHGGRLLGVRLLTWSYLASAGIFCYFAVYVIVSGYREFILAVPATAL